MTAYLLTNHLFNLMAPAAFVAGVLVFISRISMQKGAQASSAIAQFAILFIVNAVILVAGLVWFGQDAKMMTYTVMVLAAGASQWVLLRGGRR